jgi:hypothetical protein
VRISAPADCRALRSPRESSTLACCDRSPCTATTRGSSRIASSWYGRSGRNAPAAVLQRQRSPSRLLAATERSEKRLPATAWVQRVIKTCGFSWRRPVVLSLLSNAPTAREMAHGRTKGPERRRNGCGFEVTDPAVLGRVQIHLPDHAGAKEWAHPRRSTPISARSLGFEFAVSR